MKKEALPLQKLIESFCKLPGIGKKTAQRLSYYVLKLDKVEVEAFAKCMIEAREKIGNCKICKNFTDKEICNICDNKTRDSKIICVVETPKDVYSIERTREYNGLYHVLHGLISPMDGIGPEDVYIKELLYRIKAEGEVKEIIMATNATVEGEATAIYVGKLVKHLEVKATRLAYGMPVGGELEYADEMTLHKAIENRVEI